MTRLKMIIAVTAASLALAGAARAEDWRRLGVDGPVDVAVDIDSFTGAPDQRAARTVLVPLTKEAGYSYLILTVSIDCKARTITATGFAAHAGDGAVLNEGPMQEDTTTALSEADGTAAAARAACEGTTPDSERFDTAAAFASWVAARQARP